MADDDFVSHTDILSSPSKTNPTTTSHACRSPLRTGTQTTHRRLSPRKDLIEVVVSLESPEKSPAKSLEPIAEPITTAPLVAAPRKRGRPRKTIKTEGQSYETTPKKTKFDVSVKITSENILPERTRRNRKPISFKGMDNSDENVDDSDGNVDEPEENSDDEDEIADDSMDLDDTSFPEAIKEEDEEKPVEPKKRRGRPRKVAQNIKLEPTSLTNSSSNETPDVPNTPRKKFRTISVSYTHLTLPTN